MKTIYFLGECMVELRSLDDSTMGQDFAGDVYNSAVYLKRCFPALASSMITAIGSDGISDKMLARFNQHRLETQCVFRHPTKAPGVYLIETDDTGERSFTYWRNDSAARQVNGFLSESVVENLTSADMLFISGISLAVIQPQDRESLWQKLAYLKQQGVTLVFDPNYRARLWRDEQETKAQYEKAFRLADLVLPGVEDLTELYGVRNADEVLGFCETFPIGEVVIKNGPESVITKVGDRVERHQITPVTHVIDTTSAGDAFNGAYLGARLSGFEVAESVRLAAAAAGTVIQHPGAIAPEASFNLAMREAGL